MYTVAVTNKITLPLKRLTIAAQQLANGKTDIDIDCNSEDEVGVLANVFQKTARKLEEYMSNINALAYRDSLTGISNRTAYDEKREKIDQLIKDESHAFAVLVADTNGLKSVNDTYGHDAGNDVIIAAARILSEIFRDSQVFRIGGDEFAVIVEGNDLVDCERLLEVLDRTCVENSLIIGEKTMRISMARGIAQFDPEKDVRFEDVFNRADSAMYTHKQSMKSNL